MIRCSAKQLRVDLNARRLETRTLLGDGSILLKGYTVD
jgi:hypothetical protein